MVIFRSFRNTDPPKLVDIWNDALTGRGSFPLFGSALLERYVLAKPYFDPAGLILAEEAGKPIGFVHAGFAANAAATGLQWDCGVLCAMLVRPLHRRRGVGTELLRRGEDYLRGQGATQLLAGPYALHDPFYFGLYGGSEPAGFLLSDTLARPFLEKRGYQGSQRTLVWQRKLQQPLRLFDPRFPAFRQRFDLQAEPVGAQSSWWHNAVLGLLEPLQFVLYEDGAAKPAARALVWDLEGYSWRWSTPAVGIFDFQVREDLRGQGVGKYFLAMILRYVQEQCFELVELHTPADNERAKKLCQLLSFEQVDTGYVYRRSTAALAAAHPS